MQNLRRFYLLGLVLLFTLSLNGLAGARGMEGIKIMLDPGHGGKDPGAVGPTGLKEAKVNWDVAVALKHFLEHNGGATVQLTHGGPTQGATLASRTQKANQWGAHRFISIHHNGSTNPALNGTETYAYYNASQASQDLRNKVHKQLVKGLGTRDIGAKTAGFYVLRHTKMPAILTEAGFITNYYQEARLKEPAYLWRQAWYIYAGVADHFGVKY